MLFSHSKFFFVLSICILSFVSQNLAAPTVVSTLTIKGKAYHNPGGGGDTPLPGGQVITKFRFYVGGVLQSSGGGGRVADSSGNWEIEIPCSMDVGGPGASYFEVEARPLAGDIGWSGTSGGINCYATTEAEVIVRFGSIVRVDDGQNNGPNACATKIPGKGKPQEASGSVGRPINVTNGNMWLQQTDYVLPGLGESIRIDRTYNSAVQETGLFGVGWKSDYDSLLTTPMSDVLTVKSGTGRFAYFVSTQTNIFTGISAGIRAQITANNDSTYTMVFEDGRSQKFSSSGKLLWLKDRNGNQTTLNYTSGVLTSVTDAVGRTLTFSYGSNGAVSQISDSSGTIADYEYYTGTSKLKKVTYPDGSKFKFEYTTVTIGGVAHILLTTVKDALDNVIEDHTYDSSGRAITSEVDGGVESYTLDYSHSNDAVPYTSVTDGLGRVTKYYFDKSKGKNVITKTDGLCGCGGTGTESVEYEYDDRLNLVKKQMHFLTRPRILMTAIRI